MGENISMNTTSSNQYASDESMRKARSRPARGFTLTEMAIVLGVMGIILGAIWAAASQVYANKKTTAMLQDITMIVSNVRGLYPNGQIPGNGFQALAPMLINAGQIPSNMIGSCTGTEWGAGWGGTAGCALSPWNSQVIIGSQGNWGGAPVKANAFEILVGPFTNAQCAPFMMQLVQTAASAGLAFAYADGSGGTAISSTTSPTYFQNCATAPGYNVVLQFTL
jgi:prepilin-type N-terminal cleavage/methylation domain-containing protein